MIVPTEGRWAFTVSKRLHRWPPRAADVIVRARDLAGRANYEKEDLDAGERWSRERRAGCTECHAGRPGLGLPPGRSGRDPLLDAHPDRRLERHQPRAGLDVSHRVG